MPILAERSMAKTSNPMPNINSFNRSLCSASKAASNSSTASLSPSSVNTAFPVFRLTLLVADITVQVAMPMVIMRTDMYLVEVYLLPNNTIPISMLAIRLPARKIMCKGMGTW